MISGGSVEGNHPAERRVLASGLAGRDFLKLTGVTAVGFALARMPVAAGGGSKPFAREAVRASCPPRSRWPVTVAASSWRPRWNRGWAQHWN